jgi:peptidyl-prolyl cis-trans isomerase A (cyclophilin A)
LETVEAQQMQIETFHTPISRIPSAFRRQRRWPSSLRGRGAFRSLCIALAACVAALPGTVLAQAGAPSPPAPAVAPTNVKAVRVTTSMGAFVIELDSARAPLSVQNFLRYVNEGFYTNTLFHRVVGNFVAQAGGYDAGTLKLKATHEYVVNESGNGLQNKRGTVGMARAGGAHTANSQFYVNIADNTDLDPLPTRWGYAVFGRVIEGMDVIDKMGVVATGSVGELKSDAPLKPIVIEKVEALGLAGAPVSVPTPSTPPATRTIPPAGAAPAAGSPAAGSTPANGTAPADSAPPAGSTSPPPQ